MEDGRWKAFSKFRSGVSAEHRQLPVSEQRMRRSAETPLRFLWPNGNELIPLINILSNLRLECTQDLPGQFPARLAIAQRLAVIGKFREHLHGVTVAPADNRHPNQCAARRPRQFRRRQRRFERVAEQFHRHTALGRRAVERYRQGRARLKPFDDLHKGETVLADDEGLNPETPPRRDAKVGQAIVGFGLGKDRQRNAELVQQQAAMLPIAEVKRDEQDAAAALLGGHG